MMKEDLAALIDEYINADDQQMELIVGHFLSWYALAELSISDVIFRMAKATDSDRFAVLCSGMDARAKVDRLNQLAALDHGLGPNFEARLNYFYKKIIKLRNRMVHCALCERTDRLGEYQFLSLAKWAKMGGTTEEESNKLGTDVTAKYLLELSRWLQHFVSDLSQVNDALRAPRTPEIDTPRSSLPADALPNPPQPKKPAKKRKPQGRAP